MYTPETARGEISPYTWMQLHHREVVQAFKSHQEAMLNQTQDESVYERYQLENRDFSEMTACWVMQRIVASGIPLPTGYTFVDGSVVIHAPSGEASRAVTHKFFKKQGPAGKETDMIMCLTTPQFMLEHNIHKPLCKGRRTEILKQRAKDAGLPSIVEDCGEGITMVVATRKQFADVFGVEYRDERLL